nr:response regulator [uncultured Sphingomonas sp.]
MLFGKRKRVVKRILIVEDEPLTAFDNEQMLIAAGYQVVATVDRFADAMEELDGDVEIDLILSDVRLAGERSGVDLAQEAKARRIPLMFVTGSPPDQAPDLAIAVLLKPYGVRSLGAALDQVDAILRGEKVKKVKGLTLYAPESA